MDQGFEDIIAILPKPTTESAPFWEGCDRGELRLQRCAKGSHLFYYPRLFCPQCGDRELVWERCSGQGTIFSFTHVQVSFYGPKWESQLPYVPILVDLIAGPRMMSRLAGPDRDNVRIGDHVEIHFVAFEGRKLPFFRLAAR
jgi:uncharacterized protein